MFELGNIAATAGINTGFNSASGILGSLIQVRQQRKFAKQQQQYLQQNMETQHAYEQQNQHQSAMLQQQNWQKQFDAQNARQNELFLKQQAMQVQGLKNAGLNPAFSNGSQAANVSSPSVGAPGASSSANGAGVGQGSAGMPQMGMTDISSIRLNRASADNAVMQGQASLMQGRASLIKAYTDQGLAPYQADELASRAYMQTTQGSLNEQKTLESKAITERINTLTQEEVKKFNAEVALLDAQTYSIYRKLDYEIQQTCAAINLLYEEAKTEGAKRDNLGAQAAKYFAECYALTEQAKVSTQQRKLVMREANNALLTGNLMNFQVQVNKQLGPEFVARSQKAQAIIGMGTDIVSSVGSLAIGGAAVGKVFGAAAGPAKISGFAR